MTACASGQAKRPVMPVAAPASDEKLLQAARELDGYLSRSNYQGAVLIGRQDRVVFSAAYGNAGYRTGLSNTTDSVFLIASLTKPITAVCILQLAERGLLSLDASLRELFGKGPDSVTVRQLLTHTSGLVAIEDAPIHWVPHAMTHRHLESVFVMLDLPPGRLLKAAPGTIFEYNNLNYLILGAIIEQISGLEYGAYLDRNIAQPLGLANTGYVMSHGAIAGFSWPAYAEADDSWYHVYHASAGAHSTVADYFRFCQALRSGELVSADSLSLMRQAWTPGYGYGLMLDGSGYGHDGLLYGGYASRWYVDERLDYTLILLGNATRPNPDQIMQVFRLALE